MLPARMMRSPVERAHEIANPSLLRPAPPQSRVTRQDDGDAREATLYRLHGNDAATEIRIIDHHPLAAAPPGKHDEMLLLRVENAAEGGMRKVLGGNADAGGIDAETPSRSDDRPGGHAVPPGPDQRSQLAKREADAEQREAHGQACRATVRDLHLRNKLRSPDPPRHAHPLAARRNPAPSVEASPFMSLGHLAAHGIRGSPEEISVPALMLSRSRGSTVLAT